MSATLTVAQLADELGRSPTWVYEHHAAETKAGRLPPPLNGGAQPLTWSRAQVYACQDRPLPPPARLAAQAYRAAAAAAAGAAHVSAEQVEADEWRERLDRRFKQGAAP